MYLILIFRYINKLSELHVSVDNHIDTLAWDDEHNWAEKEELYRKIIKYFDIGKCWEKGVPLLKELAEFYETKMFDYVQLSKTLREEAKFFDNIMKTQRKNSEFFRIGYYGQAFPPFVRVIWKKKLKFEILNFSGNMFLHVLCQRDSENRKQKVGC